MVAGNAQDHVNVPRIDEAQFGDDLTTLARFGATAAGAVTRIAYSDADLQARDWLDGQFADLGLTVRRDQAGNSIALLPGLEAGLDALAIGSHTDTVPEGGRYDGALGLIAALACVRALRRDGLQLRHPLAVLNFAAEEATMAGATFGSRAFVDKLDPAVIERAAFDGRTVESHLEEAGLQPRAVQQAAEQAPELAAFLELHIEQGPSLDAAGIAIGIVDGIVGIRRYSIEFDGTPNHAGTTPMEDRNDALVAAGPYVATVRDIAVAHGIVATIGRLEVSPGSPNVIPGRVTMDLESRGADESRLGAAEEELRAAAGRSGAEFNRVSAKGPQPFSERLIGRLERACVDAGLSHRRLWSGAGHDAGILASVADAAMVFVPSKGGVSHSAAELTEVQDCLNGAGVLLATLVDLDASTA